ncbi:hypothetical protein [Bacterioplanoides sp.]|uniref:hypothetical protein n=1 Tax=Bacterioplanoides sp. TaxID=2066072 RepID=UPI003B0041FA
MLILAAGSSQSAAFQSAATIDSSNTTIASGITAAPGAQRDELIDCQSTSYDINDLNRLCYTSNGGETLIWTPFSYSNLATPVNGRINDNGATIENSKAITSIYGRGGDDFAFTEVSFSGILSAEGNVPALPTSITPSTRVTSQRIGLNGYRLPTIKELVTLMAPKLDDMNQNYLPESWRFYNGIKPTTLISSTPVKGSTDKIYALKLNDPTDDNTQPKIWEVTEHDLNTSAHTVMVYRIPASFQVADSTKTNCLFYEKSGNNYFAIRDVCSDSSTNRNWSYSPHIRCVYPTELSTDHCLSNNGVLSGHNQLREREIDTNIGGNNIHDAWTIDGNFWYHTAVQSEGLLIWYLNQHEWTQSCFGPQKESSNSPASALDSCTESDYAQNPTGISRIHNLDSRIMLLPAMSQ